MIRSLMSFHREVVLKRAYGRGVSYRECVRRRQHGARLRSSKVETRQVDHVGKTVRQMIHHFGDPADGFTLFKLSSYSGPGYKISAYRPGRHDSMVSQAYIYRSRREAIRAAQHRMVLETVNYFVAEPSRYVKLEKRRAFVGDEPFARAAVWYIEEQW